MISGLTFLCHTLVAKTPCDRWIAHVRCVGRWVSLGCGGVVKREHASLQVVTVTAKGSLHALAHAVHLHMEGDRQVWASAGIA